MLPAPKKNLPIPQDAKTIHKDIVSHLKRLISLNAVSPLNPDFISVYKKILDLFSQYQEVIIDNYGKRITCTKGCCSCCYHWVEDVYSFEAEIVADYIKKHFPERVEAIIKQFQEDEKELVRLNDIVEQKLAEHQTNKEIADIDSGELLLASFYQLQRPCALLSSEGKCIIYKVRPLTCRIYVSFSDSSHCSPEYINTADIPTYLLDFEEDASELLDALHDIYNRYNKSGLQALLIDYLL